MSTTQLMIPLHRQHNKFKRRSAHEASMDVQHHKPEVEDHPQLEAARWRPVQQLVQRPRMEVERVSAHHGHLGPDRERHASL